MNQLIAIPALSTHINVLRASIPRIERMFEVRPLVVTPEPGAIAPHLDDTCDLASDTDFCTLTRAAVTERLPEAKAWLSGWYYQQLLKYDIVLKCGAETVLLVDADTVLLEPVPWSGAECVFPGTSEKHHPYFRTFEALTGLSRRLERSSVVNFMSFRSTHLAALVRHIESFRGVSWREAVLATSSDDENDCSFSEYETYANWCAHLGLSVRQPRFRLFRRGDLLLTQTRTIEDVALQAERRGYEAIAFEGALHNRSVARRMTARALFAARLCTNGRPHA